MSERTIRFPLGLFPPLVLVGAVALVVVINLLVPLRMFSEGWLGHVVGWPILISGLLFVRWTDATMDRAHVEASFKPVGELVTDGPFNYSRNPMYVGTTAMYIGLAFVLNSFWPFILLPMLLMYLTYGVIRREERYLERRFGEKYRDYREGVRRWL